MSSDVSIDDDDLSLWALAPAEDEGDLVATVVEYDNVPDECTIHPLNASDEDLMTRWITALEGDFVSLQNAR